MSAIDISKVPKLSLMVTNPDGSIRYSTWNDAASEWKNVFCVFDEEYTGRDGNPIGLSYWDVPSPIEQRREIEKLQRLLREFVHRTYAANDAVGYAREWIDGDHADLLADLLAKP